MKKRPIINAVLKVDAPHERIDLHRWTAHFLALVIATWWAASYDAASDGFWARVVSACAFMVVARFMLSRMGSSRISALFIAGISLTIATYTISDLMLITLFITAALLVQEYFISLKKHIAAVVAVALGFLLPFANGQHQALLVAVVLVLGARILSYLLQERLPKKQFALFCVKAVGIVALSIGISNVIRHLMSTPYTLPEALPSIHVPAWLAIVLILLALRGLWATILLQTRRSPQYRPLRLFYIVFTAILFAGVSTISHFGDTIFLPETLQKLTEWGLVSPSVIVYIYGVLVVGLLITAGIDRWLSVSSQSGQTFVRAVGLRASSAE